MDNRTGYSVSMVTEQKHMVESEHSKWPCLYLFHLSTITVTAFPGLHPATSKMRLSCNAHIASIEQIMVTKRKGLCGLESTCESEAGW